jgi:hypothetical protein
MFLTTSWRMADGGGGEQRAEGVLSEAEEHAQGGNMEGGPREDRASRRRWAIRVKRSS